MYRTGNSYSTNGDTYPLEINIKQHIFKHRLVFIYSVFTFYHLRIRAIRSQNKLHTFIARRAENVSVDRGC